MFDLIEGNKKSKSSIFNDFVISDLIRLGYSYLIFIVFAVMLVNFQVEPGGMGHILTFTIIYIIITLIMEMLWLFLFTDKLRNNSDKDIEDKSMIHKVLNNVLPITALILGYIFLFDGFRPGGDGNRVEYLLKIISVIIFFVSYVYLFYELINTVAIGKQGKKVENALSGKVDKDNKLTYYDFLIDILYNLFQPISVLFVSIMLYYIIKMIYSGSGSSSSMESQEMPPPPPEMSAPPPEMSAPPPPA